jgi:hypothetical protein
VLACGATHDTARKPGIDDEESTSRPQQGEERGTQGPEFIPVQFLRAAHTIRRYPFHAVLCRQL